MKNKFSVLVLLAFSFVLADCSIPSQQSVFELLNGIRDTADIEGYGILEYELYDVPGNESSDFQTFILSYTQMLEEYIFDQSSKYWMERNMALCRNVKTLMYNHKRNLSTTRFLNLDGSTTFIFNFFTYGRYEFYSIDAYKINLSGSTKTIKKFVRRSFPKAYIDIRRVNAYFMKKDHYLVISNLTELLFKENVLYFPIRDKVVLNRIISYIPQSIHGRSYTITSNGFLKVENPEIARQLRNKLIMDEIISSKLFPFINLDKERDRAIRDTLDKVAKKFMAEEDINGDGKINCQDASIWFYLKYPYEVRIIVNDELHHAFNAVKIGDNWKCIEPQAFVYSKKGSYFMEDRWGSEYDSTYNEDGDFLLSFLF
jgi:hypothetical protein